MKVNNKVVRIETKKKKGQSIAKKTVIFQYSNTKLILESSVDAHLVHLEYNQQREDIKIFELKKEEKEKVLKPSF